MKILEELRKCIPEVKENIELKDYSTFKIGGKAKYFLISKNKKELKLAIEKAIELGINWKILGGGSNTLINSNGFDGLVIVFKNSAVKADFVPIKLDEENYYIETRGDWPLFFLVNESAENNLSGVEWAVGIPGTVGGAINGNAGAFNQSIGDSIEEVEALEIKNDFVFEKYFTKNDCDFSYRNSIFKKNNNLIILSAKIKLEKSDTKKIKEKIKENIERRSSKQPKGFSVGSIFKNYIGVVDEEIINQYPEIKTFQEKGSISAGYLIEECGLKGVSVGGATISSEHANFIINNGNASSDDVWALIDLIKKQVKNKFKINLEEEIIIF